MNTRSANQFKYFKIIGFRGDFLCGLKLKKYSFSKIATTLHKKAVKNSTFIVYFFYKFVAGQKNCCCREMPVGRFLLKKFYNSTKTL